MAAVGDLIDADRAQAVQPALIAVVADDVPHDPPEPRSR